MAYMALKAKALTMNSAALEGASFPSKGKQPRREKSFITTTYRGIIRSDPRLRPGGIVTELVDIIGITETMRFTSHAQIH